MACSLLAAHCAGLCYPKEPSAALAYFRSFFEREESATWSPDAETDQPPPRGILTPHIDFRVSGQAYSHAFDRWLRRPAVADVYLILGVGHRAHLPWSIDARPYQTPFGRIAVESGLPAEIAARCPFPLQDFSAHVNEHSIEFPLVLLQALRRLRGIDRPFTFLPVLCGGMFPEIATGRPPSAQSPTALLAAALREIVDRYGKRLQIIVSIDGCHIGPRFDHAYRVTPARRGDCAAWEDTLWRQVERRNLDGLFAHLGLDANARYFDGVGALTLLLKMLGENFKLTRTYYEQWFTEQDDSLVTFTSGWVE